MIKVLNVWANDKYKTASTNIIVIFFYYCHFTNILQTGYSRSNDAILL